jgi:uncharacterized protein YcbK (DUF882 family)
VLSPPVIALVLSLADGTASANVAAKPAAKPAVIRPTTAKPAAKGLASTARPVAKKRAPPKPKVIDLVQVNTHETFKLRMPVGPLQKRANHFFRCHHTQAQGRMNPRLLKLLYETGRHWPGQRLEVVSGFRHPTVAKNPHSPHMKGLACDFRVVGVKNTDLRDYLRRAFNHIGVGYYPNSSFVHLDVRQGASGFWIDYSGPGENAIYSDNAAEDLKSGRADAFKPAKIDPEWSETDEPVTPPDAGAASGQAAAPASAAPPAPMPGPPPTAIAPPPVADPQVQ